MDSNTTELEKSSELRLTPLLFPDGAPSSSSSAFAALGEQVTNELNNNSEQPTQAVSDWASIDTILNINKKEPEDIIDKTEPSVNHKLREGAHCMIPPSTPGSSVNATPNNAMQATPVNNVGNFYIGDETDRSHRISSNSQSQMNNAAPQNAV